jgi:hypothetical protein
VGTSGFDSFSYPRTSGRWPSATAVPLRRRRCGAAETRDREQIPARIRELRADALAPCRSFGSIGHARIEASRPSGGRSGQRGCGHDRGGLRRGSTVAVCRRTRVRTVAPNDQRPDVRKSADDVRYAGRSSLTSSISWAKQPRAPASFAGRGNDRADAYTGGASCRHSGACRMIGASFISARAGIANGPRAGAA